MLEIKNVTKTYHPKKGVPVLALDDVSLKFGDKGLVFILGKSGSGKSTLLNVVGGLDSCDSGEFIINGRSSKDFSQGDFDSYRNTFIGFIFQEYNILNEFSVGANIALAMELQGKKATGDALNAILEEVELTDFAGRKPNELSGGQKQRVAIARALIKQPQIIMADEPTGALDSNTGKQVFDTLKKLSKDKLVLVVSHDREFAEYYGDRVIELSDGKIISDISKYESGAQEVSDGVRIIDDDILQIKGGYALTQEDLTFINEYLSKRDGDTIISGDNSANESFRKSAMIDDGGKQSFRTTGTDDISQTINTDERPTQTFIKSRLPYKNSLKMGASGLKTKPLRLFFTVLLSFIAFAMFGFVDTIAAYNKSETAFNSLKDENMSAAAIEISQSTPYTGGEISYDTPLCSQSAIDELNRLTGMKFRGVYTGQSDGHTTISLPNLGADQLLSSDNSLLDKILSPQIFGITEVAESELGSMKTEMLSGRLPKADDEVAISSLHAETYKMCGFINDLYNESISANAVTLDDDASTGLVGKHLTFDEDRYGKALAGTYTICGIFDTRFDKEKFTANSSEEEGFGTYLKIMQLDAEIKAGLHKNVLVNVGYTAKCIARTTSSSEEVGLDLSGHFDMIGISSDNGGYYYTPSRILKTSQIPQDNIIWCNGAKTSLASNQVLWTANLVKELIINSQNGSFQQPTHQVYVYNTSDTPTQQTVSLYEYMDYYFLFDAVYRDVLANDVPQSFKTAYATAYNAANQNPIDLSDDAYRILYASLLSGNEDPYQYKASDLGVSYYENPYGESGAIIETKALLQLARNNNMLGEDGFECMLHIGSRYGEGNNGTIVGFIAPFKARSDDGSDISRTHVAAIADADFDNILEIISSRIFSYAIAPMPQDTETLSGLINLHYTDSNDATTFYSLKSGSLVLLDNFNNLFESLKEVFFYVALVLALFATLLLMNFISVSISNKKHEIGILRAVGAKSSDVYSIFFNESILIALINYVLAIVGTFAAVMVTNIYIRNAGVSLTLLNFGIRQLGLMLLISVGIAAVASFLPVYLIARKRPIEAIRGR